MQVLDALGALAWCWDQKWKAYAWQRQSFRTLRWSYTTNERSERSIEYVYIYIYNTCIDGILDTEEYHSFRSKKRRTCTPENWHGYLDKFQNHHLKGVTFSKPSFLDIVGFYVKFMGCSWLLKHEQTNAGGVLSCALLPLTCSMYHCISNYSHCSSDREGEKNLLFLAKMYYKFSNLHSEHK